jgi:hypothetical protein
VLDGRPQKLAPPDTANGALDLTNQQMHQQGEQINEMANASLYTNGQFITCSGFDLSAVTKTVTGDTVWFKPMTIYDPVVLACTGGTGPDLANPSRCRNNGRKLCRCQFRDSRLRADCPG